MKELIFEVLNDMAEELTIAQLKRLQEVLLKHFQESDTRPEPASNLDYLEMFLHAKQIEGCSERTLKYYKTSVQHLFSQIDTPVRKITTEQLRKYLTDYQKINNCGKSTVDNIRRNISSFFPWLEEEDHILKSPVRRIHKIKTKSVVKEIISDEGIERLRDNCTEIRDKAIMAYPVSIPPMELQIIFDKFVTQVDKSKFHVACIDLNLVRRSKKNRINQSCPYHKT